MSKLTVNTYPERHYDLSVVFCRSKYPQSIEWPEVELAENQFLVAYYGESLSDARMYLAGGDKMGQDLIIKHTNCFEQGFDPCIARVTLGLIDSGNKSYNDQIRLCEQAGAVMTPFVINLMTRIAHRRCTGYRVGGWNRCPEKTNLIDNSSVFIDWFGPALACEVTGDDQCEKDLLTSSLEVLAPLEAYLY